jgi:hypothetical protein
MHSVVLADFAYIPFFYSNELLTTQLGKAVLTCIIFFWVVRIFILQPIFHKDIEAAKRFEYEAKNYGIDYFIDCFDVRDFIKATCFIDDVYKRFGRIDYLVNNVGIDFFNSIFDTTYEEWELSQDIILNVPFYLNLFYQ